MAAAATSKIIDIQQILKSFEENGSSESDQFIAGAIQELEADSGQFASNIEDVAAWAIDIDEAFDRVTRTFVTLVQEVGSDFPPLAGYLNEWRAYNQRWISHLNLSRDVASEHITVLNRFDKVFIDMVEHIQTDQDRLDVIEELGQFANEDHDRSTEMSQGFLNLRRDIDDFVVRFDLWIERTGVALAERARQLQEEIELVKTEIHSLDNQIKSATIALLGSAAGASTMIGVVGLVVAGTLLAVLIAQRIGKARELSNKQRELEIVNRQQKQLAHIKSEFDGLRPDIALISTRLILFAEIWSSVRSQTVQFQATLRGGMGAVTNLRFRMELRLARDLCTPLVAGLEKYATALVNRPRRA